MKWTDDEREDAALICAIAASNPGEWFATIELGLGMCEPGVVGAIDRLHRVHQLAVYAYGDAWRRSGLSVGNPVIDAEAESLLRTGWTP